jgi:hypothetical protein
MFFFLYLCTACRLWTEPASVGQPCLLTTSHTYDPTNSSRLAMATFPDPAQTVEHNDSFLAFNLHMVDAPLSAVVLVQIRPNGVVADHSRIHIFGNVTLDSYFAATELFSFPEAEGLYLYTSTRPDGINIIMDRTTSAFMDIQASLQDRTMEIVNSDGVPVAAENFRKKLCSEGHEKNAVGGCVRWAVAVDDGQTVLELQGLPMPLKFLKPHIHTDNIPTIRLSHVPLAMDMGDGHPYQGPSRFCFLLIQKLPPPPSRWITMQPGRRSTK